MGSFVDSGHSKNQCAVGMYSVLNYDVNSEWSKKNQNNNHLFIFLKSNKSIPKSARLCFFNPTNRMKSGICWRLFSLADKSHLILFLSICGTTIELCGTQCVHSFVGSGLFFGFLTVRKIVYYQTCTLMSVSAWLTHISIHDALLTLAATPVMCRCGSVLAHPIWRPSDPWFPQ